MSFKVGWAVQTLAMYLIPLALAMILATWINEPDTVTWEIANYGFFVLAGLTFGLSVAGLLPASAESGRWVWTGPVGLLVLSAVMEISGGRYDIITLWFGSGEAGWVCLFVTWPALACCTYSAAMEWARRRRNRSLAGPVDGV
jgi:hypothetical protein